MDLYDKVSELGRRRGFIFPSFEIYGGVSGFYDYGPLGASLKRNIEEKWRDLFVRREGMVEIEGTIITPKPVFEASGHVSHFTDITTSCAKCGRGYRTDTLLQEAGVEVKEGMRTEELDYLIKEHDVRCPECGGELGASESFNLMFQLSIGPYDRSIVGYGRPEAAQGQFVDFKRLFSSERDRLPLGVAQIGRCVRNEIAPRKGPIRQREFTIVDYEVFVDPEDTSYPRIGFVRDQRLRILPASEQLANSDKVYEVTVGEALERGLVANETLAYFMALAQRFMEELGVPFDRQRFRELLPDERAHYSRQTFDQEVWLDRWRWTEVSGHAYRTDYDLRQHMMFSGVDLRVYKRFEEPRVVRKVRVIPKIEQIEADFGSYAQRVLTLLSRGDPTIIEREMRERGFYEVPGEKPVMLEPRHVEVQAYEEMDSGRHFVPHVVEPSFGIDRIFYAALEYAYTETKGRKVLRLPRDVAPISVSVFPLVSRDGLPEIAKEVYSLLIEEGFTVDYDEAGSIGRRYARADEVGVPIAVTIDYETLEDRTVTLRDINTWKQVRTKISDLPLLLAEYLRGKIEFDQMGTPLK